MQCVMVCNFLGTGYMDDIHVYMRRNTYHFVVWNSPALKTESCHDANFVFTSGTGGCRYDNRQCHKWRENCHHDNVQFPLLGQDFSFGRYYACMLSEIGIYQGVRLMPSQQSSINNEYPFNLFCVIKCITCHENIAQKVMIDAFI